MPDRVAGPRRASRLRTALLAVLALSMAGSDAFAGEETGRRRFTATYDLRFLGLPVGEATLEAEQDGGRYALDLSAGLRGVAGFFVEGSGKASVAGAASRGGRPTTSFRLDSRYAGKPVVASVEIDAGRVRSTSVEPPPTPRPDRVPVAPHDLRDVVDPLSMLTVALGSAKLDPGLCDRRIPVFDGATRADLVLSRGALVTIQDGAYRGPALDCRVRWVPISGHRALGTNVRRMAENDDMQVRLAPALGGAVLLPLSITVATGWGTVRIEATRWGMPNSDAATAATGRAAVKVRLPNAR